MNNMHRRKLKLVNRERFEMFLSMMGISILLISISIMPRPKSPIEQWHDAIEEGQTWAEYVKE